MSTSRPLVMRASAGFSLIELVVGLSLALCVALAIAPVWLSLQRNAACGADQTVQLVQGRVAVARFERDLRLATAHLCPFPVGGAVLEASPTQVVFLMQATPGQEPLLVEWEISKDALMRRWGPCPPARPVSYAHSFYADNKTMLDVLGPDSVFAYRVRGVAVEAGVAGAELAWVDAVTLSVSAAAENARGAVEFSATAKVGQ